ncbi:MAG: UbiH/UbiF/VisC/COQ6 family ubiquinone biosynthesis hydroxylase [Gammaproteobacteria bacterium]|nr:UbiH/UbiF/VisC/COQ6 family ubiquinone biosynthesis hydroxylase [Gammaproteobacteria bacterium]MDH5803294.1 UbiH/UbiF/VisC/COQ6 family ubiquinone biosynthesis hydroxylase [Gammaproteobacteria bacterium]
MNSPSHHHFDIVIIGGGMVGTTLACALNSSGLSVALVEGQQPQEPMDTDFDLRVSAITRASERIFRNLDVWPILESKRICPFREMFVWDAGGSGAIHFDSAQIGEATLGHIIENRVMQWALFRKAESLDCITLFCPDRPQQLRKLSDGYEVGLESGQTLRTALIVGADGAQSWVRQQAGISQTQHDYHQTACVCTVRTEQPHKETAWQIFRPSGPLAFLPLGKGYSSIVWSTSPNHANALMEMETQDFNAELQQAFENKLGPIVESGPRATFPLMSRHAKQYVLPHLALIGDAAHTIHPLAGQGVNLGLADATALAQVITQANGFSHYKTLRRYERWRKGENHGMQAAMSGFKYLFSNNNALLHLARNWGLNAADAATPLKNRIIRHAMGLSGDLPELASHK